MVIIIKDCFLLRFNCQKSGLDMPNDAKLFGNLFEESEENIIECIEWYNKTNQEALFEISNSVNIEQFKNKYKDKRILFVGDSITSDRMSYGKIIGSALPDNVIDKAISGSRSVDVASTVYRNCVEEKPDYVSLLVGNNDSVFLDENKENTSVSIEEYARNLNIIIDKVEKFGAVLIINSVAPIHSEVFNKNNLYWSASEESNSLFNETACTIAKKRNVIFNDFRTVFTHEEPKNLFEPDGIHLSPYAHKKIAAKLIDTLLNVEE